MIFLKYFKFLIFFFTVFLLGFLALSQENSNLDLLKLSQDPQWLRLIHYKKKWSLFNQTSYLSEVDHPQFFLSPEGKHSPLKELEATLLAIKSKSKREIYVPQTKETLWLTPICQFPARALWLQEQLKQTLTISSLEECPEFKQFLKRTQTKSVTLIFSSYYMNNPSSTFGHSLLRLNRLAHSSSTRSSTPLLDTGVNYAANSTTDNPILFATMGLFGGFPGTFTILPYYYKVREYNDYESRDLWEYDLDLNQNEIDQLINHLWELSFTTFDYYYLSENCSYHMLTLLEAAAPRLKLTNQLPFWVIPGETIRIVNEVPNLVKRVNYRPSIHTMFLTRFNLLSKPQQNAFNNWEDHQKNWKGSLTLSEQAEVLDTALDYYDYKYSRELLLEKSGPKLEEKNYWLVERSLLPTTSPITPYPSEDMYPHKAHPSARGGIGLNSQSDLSFSWRFALHDFLDPSPGYPKYAQIDFLSTHWSILKKSRYSVLKLEQLNLLGLTSLSPFTSNEKNISWRLFTGWEEEHHLSSHQIPFYLLLGAGITHQFSNPYIRDSYLYALLQSKISHTFQKFKAESFFFSYGPLLGFRWSINNKLNLFSEIFHEEVLAPYDSNRIQWKISQTYQFKAHWLFEIKWQNSSDFKKNRGSFEIYHYF